MNSRMVELVKELVNNWDASEEDAERAVKKALDDLSFPSFVFPSIEDEAEYIYRYGRYWVRTEE